MYIAAHGKRSFSFNAYECYKSKPLFLLDTNLSMAFEYFDFKEKNKEEPFATK
jgi:hypothetical protein